MTRKGEAMKLLNRSANRRRRSAMKLRTTVLGAALMVAFAVMVASTSAAEGTAAVKAPLIHNPLNNCHLGADALPGGTPTSSFAVINDSPTGVHATVVLHDGRPDVTYTVYLIQSTGLPSSLLDCLVPDASLVTNHAGNGTVVIREGLLPGAAFVHAYLFTLEGGGFDYFDTGLVPVS